MRIDHSRLHVFVAQQLLHGANIVPTLEEMRGEAVAKGMAADAFCDACPLRCNSYRLLQAALVEMMAARDPRARVSRISDTKLSVSRSRDPRARVSR